MSHEINPFFEFAKLRAQRAYVNSPKF